MIVLQEWTGWVESVGEDTFRMRIQDVTEPKNPEEMAEMPISKIPKDEQKELVPGTYLDWIIYFDNIWQKIFRRTAKSKVIFKHYYLTDKQMDEAKKEAKRLYAWMNSEAI